MRLVVASGTVSELLNLPQIVAKEDLFVSCIYVPFDKVVFA
jgi:hypothetical protein